MRVPGGFIPGLGVLSKELNKTQKRQRSCRFSEDGKKYTLQSKGWMVKKAHKSLRIKGKEFLVSKIPRLAPTSCKYSTGTSVPRKNSLGFSSDVN